jgi:SAM-dependent methyltransferase
VDALKPGPSPMPEPSAWVLRWAPLVGRGPVLDVACGAGRHARYFASRGLEVVAVDRAPQEIPGVAFVQADLETNYLHRPLFPALAACLAQGGVLIYETFMAGNERHGKPSNPAFLLRPGELLAAFGALTVLGFEQGTLEHPKRAVVQRICALRGDIGGVRIPA